MTRVLQTLPRCSPATIRRHTNICHVVLGNNKRILVQVTLLTAIQAYDMSKALILAATPNRTTKELSIAELATAGFLSAVPTTLVTAPVERAKVLLQVRIILHHTQLSFMLP